MSRRLLLILGLLTAAAGADTPVTSTDFWQVYQDIPEVQLARRTQTLDETLMTYLVSEQPIDHKAAVINALSWDSKAMPRNFVVFEEWLAAQHGAEPDQLLGKLSAHEAFCLGYVNALDQYVVPSFALPYLYRARQGMPRSFTVAMITAIVEAQDVYDQWEKIWPIVVKPTRQRDLRMDMRPAAREALFKYLDLYREHAR